MTTPGTTRSTLNSLMTSRFREALLEPAEMTPEQRARHDERLRKAKEARGPEEDEIYAKIRLNEKKGYTSLEPTEWEVSFESLEVVEQNRKPLERIQNWTPDMVKGVVLYGPVGTGKSTVCKCLINKWASSEYRCLFLSLGKAMQRLKDAIGSNDTTVSMEEEKLIRPGLLIIDDLGADVSSDWTREKIFTIFESRARQGKHTIFTTNLDPEEISTTYGGRIKDRMVEFCSWVNMPGKSFRQMNFKNEI